MPTYYIDNCEHVKDVDGKYGMLAIYNLTVKNDEGTFQAELAQKTSTPAPSGTIKGSIEGGQFGNRFRKDKPAQENRTEYTSGRTPEERNSIVRQHSQQMAVMWIAILQKNTQTAPQNVNYEYLKGVIDWFVEDARA